MNVKKAIAEYTTKFLDMRKEKNPNKNYRLDSDTVKAKSIFDKIELQLNKFARIVSDEDRIATTIKKSSLPEKARQMILKEVNEGLDDSVSEQIAKQKTAYLDSLDARLRDSIDLASYEDDGMPVNTIIVGVFAIVLFLLAIVLAGSKKSGLPTQTAAVRHDWGGDGKAYNRKEI